MTPRSKLMLVALGILTVLALAGAPALAAEGSFDRTLKVTGPVTLDVTTGSGSIAVRAGGSGSVTVHGRIRTSSGWLSGGEGAESRVRQIEQNPPIEQTGNTIRIGRIENPELRRHIAIDYEIDTPKETQLTASSGSGGETIQGLQGPVKANTGSGSIRVSDISGEVRAETGSGDIQLDSIQGNLSAQTGSGSIRGEGLGAGAVASTGSGNIRLQQTGQGSVRVETGSGSVELQGVRGSARARTGSGSIRVNGEPAGDWNLETGSGGLDVNIPANVGFALHAHTGSGDITTNRPITVQGKISRHDLQGKVGNGGYLLRLETGSGNIRIE